MGDMTLQYGKFPLKLLTFTEKGITGFVQFKVSQEVIGETNRAINQLCKIKLIP